MRLPSDLRLIPLYPKDFCESMVWVDDVSRLLEDLLPNPINFLNSPPIHPDYSRFKGLKLLVNGIPEPESNPLI